VVGVGPLHGHGELALETTERVGELVEPAPAHEHSRGAEDLLAHRCIVAQGGGRRRREQRRWRVGPLPGTALGIDADTDGAPQRCHTLVVRLGDPGRQHRLTRGLGDRPGGRRNEGVAVGTGRHEGEAGVRAELAGAQGERADVCRRERFRAPVGDAARQDDDGVDRAHLRVDGDGLAPGRCSGDERQATGPGAGEADSLDARVAHQRLPDGRAAAEDEGEHACR